MDRRALPAKLQSVQFSVVINEKFTLASNSSLRFEEFSMYFTGGVIDNGNQAGFLIAEPSMSTTIHLK